MVGLGNADTQQAFHFMMAGGPLTLVKNGSPPSDHKVSVPLYDGPGAAYTCKK